MVPNRLSRQELRTDSPQGRVYSSGRLGWRPAWCRPTADDAARYGNDTRTNAAVVNDDAVAADDDAAVADDATRYVATYDAARYDATWYDAARHVTAHDAAGYAVTNDVTRHATANDAARHVVAHDAARYAAAYDATRHVTTYDATRHDDVARHVARNETSRSSHSCRYSDPRSRRSRPRSRPQEA